MIDKSKLENIHTINHNLNILFKLHQGVLSFLHNSYQLSTGLLY